MGVLGYTGPGAPMPGSVSSGSFLPSWSMGSSAFTGISTFTGMGALQPFILAANIREALPDIMARLATQKIAEKIMPTPQLQTFKAAPPVSIPPSEMAEIDEAIRSGTALYVPPLPSREAFSRAAEIVISGEAPPLPTVLQSPPTGSNQSNIAAATPGSTGYDAVQGGFGASEDPLNLSSILGGITDIAQTYAAVRTVISPPPVQYALPSAAPPPVYQQLAPTPAAAIARTAQYTPTALPIQTAAFPLALPAVGGAVATLGAGAMSLFSSVGKIAGIAAATGLGTDMIAGILEAGKPKRRRRRMLTKSDTADIATMAALLGKGSESFKTWLAIATRR